MRILSLLLTFTCIQLTFAAPARGVIKSPTKPLKERVAEAETIFIGKVVNKEVEGDWATAELLVEQPLKNAKLEAKVPVTWRIRLGQLFIYDVAEGTRGIALLGDKHQDRYWLRADKFEDLKKLDEVTSWLEREAAQSE